MNEVNFNGKSYPMRDWLQLTGQQWLKITEHMESAVENPGQVPNEIRAVCEILSPKSMRDHGQWSFPERMEFFRLAMEGIELPLGSAVLQRYNKAFPGLVEVIRDHYSIKE